MSQNPFEQKKKSIIESLAATVTDASPKGTVDEICWPIIKLINEHKNMVTTSSCSGRVSVFLEGVKTKGKPEESEIADGAGKETKPGGKGQGGRWLYITHNRSELDDWYVNTFSQYEPPSQQAIDSNKESGDTRIKFGYVESANVVNTESTRYVLYKFEPFILHVLCRDFASASELYETAMSCGFRESGIGKNNIVAIRISIKLDMPIGYFDETNQSVQLFVNESALKLITEISKEKFLQNESKIDQLYKKIAEMGTRVVEKKETKEERRARKIREGLERQRQMKSLNNARKEGGTEAANGDGSQ